MSGHLYILTDGINTKIGITVDLDKRISSYKTHNPNFRQFKVYSCDLAEAKRVESVIKQAFKDKLSGSSKEWFRVSPEIIDRYASVLLMAPTETNITPAMHGVRLTNEAAELKDNILKALAKHNGYSDGTHDFKKGLSEIFASRFGLGVPTHKLPDDDIVIRDGLCVDLENCDKKSSFARKGVEENYVKTPYEDHSYNFYHLIKLASSHFIAVCTARVSMPYLERIEGKKDEIVEAANQVGWYATFHHDWSWHYPDKSALILFQKQTAVPITIRQWNNSFRKWVIERSEILKQEKFEDQDALEKGIEDIVRDCTFPLDISNYQELCDKYLEPFYGISHGSNHFLKEAYSFLLNKWNDSKAP